MGTTGTQRDDLEDVLKRESADEAERRDSRILLDALHARRHVVGGSAAIPAEDQKLSEQIMAQARTRSAEIRAQKPSGTTEIAARAIPWWLWAGWIIAIIAVVVAFKYLS